MSIARWMEGRKGQREKEKERGRQSDRGSWFVGWLSEGSARPRDALDNKTQARWASYLAAIELWEGATSRHRPSRKAMKKLWRNATSLFSSFSAFLPHSDLLDTRSWIRLLSRADNQQLTYKNGGGIRRHTSVNATKLDYPTIEIRIDKGTSIKVQKSKLEKQKGAGRSQETLDRLGSNCLPWLFPSSRVSEESNEMMREGHRQGSILKRRWRRPSGSWGLGVAQ
jgi:hypothetical protein